MSDTFCRKLVADAPLLPPGATDLFGHFIGSWDLKVAWYRGGTTVREARGEWHFARVLGGRAVQDIWIVPTLAEQARGAVVYEYGTSLRFPAAEGGHWHSQWSGPVNGLAAAFTAREVPGGIVLDGSLPGGLPVRWSFHDIKADRFRWKNERAPALRAGLELVQDFVAVRRG